MKKISVIVPVYNAEKYIGKCIESIVTQTYTNLEVILVDDGSPDNSGAICDEWAKKDDRIKVIHKQNGGTCAARNTALDIATGEYISFLDNDDWLSQGAYEKAVSEIENDNLDMISFGFMAHYTDHTVTNNLDFTLYSQQDYQNNISSFLYAASGIQVIWNKLYKADIIKDHNIRFAVGRYHEDGLFNLDFCSVAARVKCITDVFYNYTLYGENQSWKSRTDYLSHSKYFHSRLREFALSKGVASIAEPAIEEKYVGSLYFHLMYLLLPDKKISFAQRKAALKELYRSTEDDKKLKLYLKNLDGYKYRLFNILYTLRQSTLLLLAVHFQSFLSRGK